MTRDTIATRLFKKVNKTNGCWFWIGCLSNGNPIFSIPPSKAVSPTRYLWEMRHGKIPLRGRLSNTCGHKMCIHPDHWYLRTKEVRFHDFVKKTESCWLWTGTSTTGGYGQFSVGGRLRLAHRIAYEMFVGGIPQGLDVLHSCDNPPCVNPAHLFLGTDHDNQRDCISKGRKPSSPTTKLTPDVVREIRATPDSALALAAKYGVTRATIYSIRARKTWKDV